jgi:Mlc titration factor MtfA (ptsG expression regulator)
MPPLHANMVRRQWTDNFSHAFDYLQQHRPDINSCAATAPAVFFAVVSEYFFSDPNTLRHHSSAAYDQRVLFDRQDPASRQAESGSSRSGQI